MFKLYECGDDSFMHESEIGNYVMLCDHIKITQEKDEIIHAYKTLLGAWKEKVEMLRVEHNVDLDALIETTREVARRSSKETDSRLAKFIMMGDAAGDVSPPNGGKWTKDSLRDLILEQKSRSHNK
ncbi:MAG: hypothetical protein [Caudoviricetes sp.]|nr:MAG: hypothetical protein [Caudoviricetes sp.]